MEILALITFLVEIKCFAYFDHHVFFLFFYFILVFLLRGKLHVLVGIEPRTLSSVALFRKEEGAIEPEARSSLALSWQVLMEANLVASRSTCVLALKIEKLECIQVGAKL